ncbi:MAG TPA: hypothetical protein VKY59_12450, partial [Spirillospora sp.]|nr:hypothetical protein [Spirillospora sp.]
TLNADVTATLQMRGFAETMPVSTSPPVAIPEESSAELRLVDGMLYVNFDTLEPPLEDGTLVGWGRYPLAARLDRPAPQATPEASPVPALSTGQDVNHLLETFDEQTLREFLSVSRTDDVFETRMNFAAMYAHPTVQAVVREQLQARFDRFGNPLQITDQHMAHLADQMAQVFPEPVVLQSLTVDPDWRVVRGFSIWGMWDFNIMMEAALRGDVTGWGLATTEVRVEVSEYNQIEPILAPEVSHPVDAETLARIPPLAWVLPSNGQAAEDLSE